MVIMGQVVVLMPRCMPAIRHFEHRMVVVDPHTIDTHQASGDLGKALGEGEAFRGLIVHPKVHLLKECLRVELFPLLERPRLDIQSFHGSPNHFTIDFHFFPAGYTTQPDVSVFLIFLTLCIRNSVRGFEFRWCSCFHGFFPLQRSSFPIEERSRLIFIQRKRNLFSCRSGHLGGPANFGNQL